MWLRKSLLLLLQLRAVAVATAGAAPAVEPLEGNEDQYYENTSTNEMIR